jgi:uncharacterized OB-fold protein
MKRVIMMLSASGFVLALAMVSWAQVKVLPTQTVTVDGTVETIDHPKRVVTIKTTTGEFVTLDVPESVQRFNEVKVGDKVKATYNNNVTVRLKPPGEPAVDTAKTAKTGGEGARPGGMAAMERTMTATITAIDKSASSMTFVGPNDWKYSRRVVDPKVFDQVKVGDQVDITWITDVTVAVLSAEAPSAGQPAMAASVVDPNLVGTWETHDGPCTPCTLIIDANGTTRFALAGSAVQIVFSQVTPEPGIDLIFPSGGKADLALSKSNVLMGFYTSPRQPDSKRIVAFRRK